MFADLSSRITEKLSWFRLVFTALEENKRLKAENQLLSFENVLYHEIKEQNDRLKELLDFKKRIPFKLATGNINHWNTPLLSTITIDLGRNDGVAKNDPVITNNGLVGKIIVAGKISSICQLLTDANFRVSAQVRNSEIIGFLRDVQGSYAVMDINGSADIAVGDSIITSSYGDIYPNGISIGTVVDFTNEPGLFKTVTVELFVDYASLREVSVIIDSDSDKDSR